MTAERSGSRRSRRCPDRGLLEVVLDGAPVLGAEAILEHAERCPRCRRVVREIEALDLLIGTELALAEPEEALDAVPAGLIERMKRIDPKAVRSPRIASCRRRAVSARSLAPARASARLPRSGRLPLRHRRGATPATWAAPLAIAAAVLAAGIVFIIAQRRPSAQAPSQVAAERDASRSPVERHPGSTPDRTLTEPEPREVAPRPAAARDPGAAYEGAREDAVASTDHGPEPTEPVGHGELAREELAQLPLEASGGEAPSPRPREAGPAPLPFEKELIATGPTGTSSGRSTPASLRPRAVLRPVHTRGILRKRGEILEPLEGDHPEIAPNDALVASKAGGTLLLGHGVEVAAARGTVLSVSKDEQGEGYHVALDRGALLFTAPSGGPSTVRLHTGHGAVLASGAEVIAERDADGARVAVARGTASLPDEPVSRFIQAGERVLFSASAAPLVETVRDVQQKAQAFARLGAQPRVILRADFDRGPGLFRRHALAPGERAQSHAVVAGPTDDDDRRWGVSASASKAKLFTGSPRTVIRFRYFLAEKHPLMLRAYQKEKGVLYALVENDPTVGAWATFECAADDLKSYDHPVPATAEDVFASIEMLSGDPEHRIQLLIDDLEILSYDE